jgi:hypothetical protein
MDELIFVPPEENIDIVIPCSGKEPLELMVSQFEIKLALASC